MTTGEGELLDFQQYYSLLPYDLAGSRSKNRFRVELLWGISKMLDVYDSGDFILVFDYVCDVEVHTNGSFSFYQIKSHSNDKKYTCKSLSKVDGESSILGKLFALRLGENQFKTKLAVVSNAYLSVERSVQTDLEYCFDNLPEKERDILSKNLMEELNTGSIDFKNVLFIHTDMNLKEPKNEVIGKLIVKFEQIKGCEPVNPNALYRILYDTVVEKACFEYKGHDYSEVVATKGISKDQLDQMLNVHAANSKTGIKQTEDYINKITNLTLQRECKRSLPRMIISLAKSTVLKTTERQIGDFLFENQEIITTIEATIEILKANFDSMFSIEYSSYDRYVLYIIFLYRFTEGVYDK